MVIWVTGISGSGKTALCAAIWDGLKPILPELVRLDGDAVRAAIGDGLGYREEDRRVQIQRLQRLAKILSDQGLVVLVAALYSHPDLLEWNRLHMKEYFEIYLEASLELVRRRDPKGIYASAAVTGARNVVGLDIPWHAPARPDLVIQADSAPSPADLVRCVVDAVPRLRAAAAGSRR